MKRRIGPFRFQAGCRRRRLNLALVFCLFCVVVHFFWLVNACFCCVRLSFSIPSQEVGLGECLRNDLFCVEWDIKPNSVNQLDTVGRATRMASGMWKTCSNYSRSSYLGSQPNWSKSGKEGQSSKYCVLICTNTCLLFLVYFWASKIRHTSDYSRTRTAWRQPIGFR